MFVVILIYVLMKYLTMVGVDNKVAGAVGLVLTLLYVAIHPIVPAWAR
jgi:hypothetical protein